MSMKDLKRRLRERNERDISGSDARTAVLQAHMLKSLEDAIAAIGSAAPAGSLSDAREAYIALYTLTPEAVIEIAAMVPDAKES